MLNRFKLAHWTRTRRGSPDRRTVSQLRQDNRLVQLQKSCRRGMMIKITIDYTIWFPGFSSNMKNMVRPRKTRGSARPRYLNNWTCWRDAPARNSEEVKEDDCREITMYLHLFGFRDSKWELIQWAIRSKSDCTEAMQEGEEITWDSRMSSAYREQGKMDWRQGAQWGHWCRWKTAEDPRQTPEEHQKLHDMERIEHHQLRPVASDELNNFESSRWDGTPSETNLSRRSLCGTESNAFLRSKKRDLRSSRIACQDWVTDKRAVSVE